MFMGNCTERFSFALSKQLYEKMKNEAAEAGISESEFIRHAVMASVRRGGK
jgi:metal-responsive CopG/Arc/MetJ family transcriptional regulator